MAITTRSSGTVTVVKLDGKLTSDDGATEFGDTVRTLLENGRRQILLNYDLVYVDSAGMAEFKKAYFVASGQGATIKIVVPKRVGQLGLINGAMLLTLFDSYDDEAQAIASFGGDHS
jgi:anti-anti-sigma regulatory factor